MRALAKQEMGKESPFTSRRDARMICAGITKKSKALLLIKQEGEHIVRKRNGGRSSRRARKKAKAYSYASTQMVSATKPCRSSSGEAKKTLVFSYLYRQASKQAKRPPPAGLLHPSSWRLASCPLPLSPLGASPSFRHWNAGPGSAWRAWSIYERRVFLEPGFYSSSSNGRSASFHYLQFSSKISNIYFSKK